jgi:glycosyltransferase involved in cell wall biosynthesis
MRTEPLVSVVTPVHNGAKFLAECIESVLVQTHGNFEYILVDDCSTDASLDVACRFAGKDPRVRVERNAAVAGVMANHNIAFSLISPVAKYCKVVSPEDFLFPHCIQRLVEVAEANPSVGFVGSYQLVDSVVRWQGFEYPGAVLSGREVCRRVLLGGRAGFGFGTPTSMLYRADLVRAGDGFYPDAAPHSDASACFKFLKKSDFGFVHQVLSYGRMHAETESSKSTAINRYASAYLSDLIQYGPLYLSKAELGRRMRQQLADYHQFLAFNVVRRRGKEFWQYHRARLEELGHPIRPFDMLKAAVTRILREILNPEQAIRKCWKRVFTATGKACI